MRTFGAVTDVEKGIQSSIPPHVNSVISHGAPVVGIWVFADHTHTHTHTHPYSYLPTIVDDPNFFWKCFTGNRGPTNTDIHCTNVDSPDS